MKLKKLASNMTLLVDAKGTEILYSYETPVACFIPGQGYFRTATKHSVTTSRHINKWLEGVKAEERPQEHFDNMVK